MSVFATGVGSQFLRRPLVGNIGNEPMSLSCWVKGTLGNGYLFAFVSASAVVCFDWYSGTMYAEYYDGTGARTTAQTGNFGSNILTNWTHFGLTLNGPSSITAYLNGSASGFASVLANSTNISNTMIEVAVGGATAPYSASATTQIAECALWRGALSGAQWSAIARGESPGRIMPGKLQDYFPLRGDGRNLGLARIGLAPVGGYTPRWGDHPNVVQLSPRRIFAVSSAVPLSGTINYGAESFAGTLTDANPLQGDYSYGAEQIAATLTQANAVTGAMGYSEVEGGTLSQTNSYIGTLTFNPSVIGTLVEEDSFIGTVSYASSFSGVIALDVHGSMNYGPQSVTGTISLDLHGSVDYGSPADSGLLTQANPLTGTISNPGLSALGVFSSAEELTGVLDYAASAMQGNLLEVDTFSGTISYSPTVSGVLVGALFAVMDYGHSVTGTLAQVNSISSCHIGYEVTSGGVLTDADNIVGFITYAAPSAAGSFDAVNPLSGTPTFGYGMLGNLLEQDILTGEIDYPDISFAGELSEHDLFDGAMDYDFQMSGEAHSVTKDAPAPSTLPPGRMARVRFDSRRSASIPFDSRIAR